MNRMPSAEELGPKAYVHSQTGRVIAIRPREHSVVSTADSR